MFSLVHNTHTDVAADAGIEMNPILASASNVKIKGCRLCQGGVFDVDA